MCPTFSQAFAKPQFRNIEGKRKKDALYKHFRATLSTRCLSLSVFVFVFKMCPMHFLDALASLELVMRVTGSPIFREISVNKTFGHTDLQPYNLTNI